MLIFCLYFYLLKNGKHNMDLPVIQFLAVSEPPGPLMIWFHAEAVSRSYGIQRSQVSFLETHLLPPFQSCCQYIRVPARDGTAAFPVPWQGQPQSLHLSSVLSACNFFPIGLAPQTACFPIHSGRRGYKVRRKQQFAVLLLFWCPIF